MISFTDTLPELDDNEEVIELIEIDDISIAELEELDYSYCEDDMFENVGGM